MFDGVTWRKSSRSDAQGSNCVEIALAADLVGVRDSKDRDGTVLTFGAGDWASFLDGVKAGDFDLR